MKTITQEKNSATPRLGPRPLPLHLMTAMASSMSALAALPNARAGSLPWSRDLIREAAELACDLQAVELGGLTAAVARQCGTRMAALQCGMTAYHAHQYRRDPDRGRELCRIGNARLLDYGCDGDGPAVLFVPSLVNRYHVLDLTDRVSLLNWLSAQGFRPLVVDWGDPGAAEKEFAIGDYVERILAPMAERAAGAAAREMHLVGYCMGGNLALALALRPTARFASLSLLATPWDFHADEPARAAMMLASEGFLDGILAGFGELPVDMLQALFAGLDPNLAQRKFRAFAKMDGDSQAAETFVALEDWLNDGVPLAPAVAREVFLDWYGRNVTAEGVWQVGGRAVDPGEVSVPALVAVPARDRIVPPKSARALAAQLPDPEILEPDAGHIGMVVGRGGMTGLWQPLAAFLRRNS